jgi:hypothetical protein
MVVERLLTDEHLRIRFALDRMETVAELLLQGFDLTRDEITLFCRTDPRVWFLGEQRMRAAWTGVYAGVIIDTRRWAHFRNFIMNMSTTGRHHVVIVGCGFAGLSAVKGLRRANVDVTVIDRTNHHLIQPLLCQVATGILSEGDIASPIRDILRPSAMRASSFAMSSVSIVGRRKPMASVDEPVIP